LSIKAKINWGQISGSINGGHGVLLLWAGHTHGIVSAVFVPFMEKNSSFVVDPQFRRWFGV